MRRATIIFSALMVLLIGRTGAQSPTNFSGKWVPADPATADELFKHFVIDIPASGMVISQDDKTLTVTRNGWADEPLKTVYNLDGTLARNPLFGRSVTTSKASWDGSSLIVSLIGGLPTRLHGTGHWQITFSLTADGLRVETSGEKMPTALFYKRG